MSGDSYADRFQRAWDYWKASHPGAGDKEFAEAIGVSPAHFSGLKRRAVPPGDALVRRIAEAAGVDPGWLMFGSASSAPMVSPSNSRRGRHPAAPGGG